jgi:hypothetical protein
VEGCCALFLLRTVVGCRGGHANDVMEMETPRTAHHATRANSARWPHNIYIEIHAKGKEIRTFLDMYLRHI